MKPTRILMTTETGCGIWTFCVELARALRPKGIEIALAAMGARPSTEQRAQAAAAGNIELYDEPFALEWMPDPWRDVGEAGQWLLMLEEQFHPDAIHLNGYCHGSLPWNAPVLITAHSCVLSRWQAIHGEPAPNSWGRYQTEVSAGLRGADRIVAATRTMLNSLESYSASVPNSCRSKVIFNSRDAAQFPVLEKKTYVLSVGRAWDDGKNMEALATAAPEIPWPVFLVGSTENPDGVAASFESLNCLGPLPPREVASWMGFAPIFALPARYEALGLTVIEAGLAGCALVLGDIPSLREVWGDAALFAPPGDPSALSAAIRRLISDEPFRIQMAARARQRALTLTPERMAESYLECYRELLAEADAHLTAHTFQ